MTEQPIETQEVNAQFEPPTSEQASTNFYWTVGQKEVFNLQTTVRGALVIEQVEQHLATVIDALKAVVERGGHAKAVGAQPRADPPAPAVTAAPGAPATPAPVAPPAPAQPQASGPESIIATRLVVVPQAEGKSKIEFYADGHKFPDLSVTRKLAELRNMLRLVGEWTDAHLSAAGDYGVKYRVEYTLSSKLNSKGNPYKDIAGVHPA